MTKQHTGPQAAALHTVHSKGRPVVSLGCLLQPACWEQFTHGIKQRSMLPFTAVQHCPGQPFWELSHTASSRGLPFERNIFAGSISCAAPCRSLPCTYCSGLGTGLSFIPAMFYAQHWAEAYLSLHHWVDLCTFFASNVLHTMSNWGLPSAGALGCLGQPFCQQSVTACAWRSAAWPPQHPRSSGPAVRVCCSVLQLLPENTKAISNYWLLCHLQEAFSSTSTKVLTKMGQNSPLKTNT